MRPPIELTFTIRPRPRRRAGRRACVTATCPTTFTSSWRRSSSIGTNSIGALTAIPALLTRPASGASPSSSAAVAIEAASVTSSLSGVTPADAQPLRVAVAAHAGAHVEAALPR